MKNRVIRELLEDLEVQVQCALTDHPEERATAQKAVARMTTEELDAVGIVELRKQLALARTLIARTSVSLDQIDAKNAFMEDARRLGLVFDAFAEHFGSTRRT